MDVEWTINLLSFIILGVVCFVLVEAFLRIGSDE